MNFLLANAALQSGFTTLAATNLVTSNLLAQSTVLASSSQTNLEPANPIDSYVTSSSTGTASTALATAVGTAITAIPAVAAAQAEDTPPALEIYGPQANNGIGDIPIVNPPDHFYNEHFAPLLGALIAYGIPLTRLTTSTIRLLIPNFLLPKAMKMSTAEAAETSGLIQGANRFVGGIAASKTGTALAWLRNIGGLVFIGASLHSDSLRVLTCYLPEAAILVGTATSFVTRFRVWRALRKLEKAGQLEDGDRQMHRRNALGLLPHRVSKPTKSEPTAPAEQPEPPAQPEGNVS